MHAREVIDALKTLDHENDDHWTVDGSPRLDAIVSLPGITRQMLTHVAPQFARNSPDLPDLDAQRESAESLMKEADLLAAKAEEAKQVAKQKMFAVAAVDRNIKDPHEHTRSTNRWIEGQMKQILVRAERQRAVDNMIREAGGKAQMGKHPVEVNEAARVKARRRNIVLPAKPQ